MSTTRTQSAVDLLREAAEILRDPGGGRNPEDVGEIASALEIIAARAAEWEISALLAIEDKPIMPPIAASPRRRPTDADDQHNRRVSSQRRNRDTAYRLMAQFLRESGF